MTITAGAENVSTEIAHSNGHHPAGGVRAIGEPHDGGAGRSGSGGNALVHALETETRAATALIEQLRDMLADDDEYVVASAIEGETNLHEAICAGLNRLAELNGLMDGIAGMMASLKDRGERFEKQRDRIREAISVAMEAGQIKRLEFPIGTVSLRSVAPSVVPTDESAIPARFWKAQDPKLDKRELLKALKDGESVPGAQLSNGGNTITVKLS